MVPDKNSPKLIDDINFVLSKTTSRQQKKTLHYFKKPSHKNLHFLLIQQFSSHIFEQTPHLTNGNREEADSENISF